MSDQKCGCSKSLYMAHYMWCELNTDTAYWCTPYWVKDGTPPPWEEKKDEEAARALLQETTQ